MGRGRSARALHPAAWEVCTARCACDVARPGPVCLCVRRSDLRHTSNARCAHGPWKHAPSLCVPRHTRRIEVPAWNVKFTVRTTERQRRDRPLCRPCAAWCTLGAEESDGMGVPHAVCAHACPGPSPPSHVWEVPDP